MSSSRVRIKREPLPESTKAFRRLALKLGFDATKERGRCVTCDDGWKMRYGLWDLINSLSHATRGSNSADFYDNARQMLRAKGSWELLVASSYYCLIQNYIDVAWLYAQTMDKNEPPGPRMFVNGWFRLHMYHGSRATPEEIKRSGGLRARSDRGGLSVTTGERRALYWGGFKTEKPYVYRVRTETLEKLSPENALPACPNTEFTTDRVIPVEHLEVKRGGKWALVK